MAENLKGGHTTEDPRLDRVPEFDEKSRAFAIRTILPSDPKSKTWPCKLWNDQGKEGACVGFAWSHELTASPNEFTAPASVALRIYKRAQQIDEWPGEGYSGTSVLAGAKSVQELKSRGKKIMPEYRWAFGVDDLILAIGHHGPAVLGLSWFQGMMNTNEKGYIAPVGSQIGGHAILARGIKIYYTKGSKTKTLEDIDRTRSYFILRNSWGKKWGDGGDCRLTIADMDTLLRNKGEACIPVRRVE